MKIIKGLILGVVLCTQANAKPVCDKPIPITKADNSFVDFAYTDKVKNGPYKDAIPHVRMILNTMTQRLSPLAIQALNKTMLVIYHCDPSLKSGLDNRFPYDTKHYDYLTLLSPKSKCEDFQKNPKTFDGRSWDKTVGAGVALGVVVRNTQGKLQCTVPDSETICDTTTICDVNLVTSKHDPYYEENVLVHEFAHTIQNVALPNGDKEEREWFKGINEAFKTYKKNICPQMPNSYACSNSDEMWAEASQAWFGATCRTELKTNIGLTTPKAIYKNLPTLYKILEQVYGRQKLIKKIPIYSGRCG